MLILRVHVAYDKLIGVKIDTFKIHTLELTNSLSEITQLCFNSHN